MEMAMVKVMCVCGREWESCARASAHAHARVHEEASERPRRPIVQQSLKVDEWACNINPSCSSRQTNFCTLSQAARGSPPLAAHGLPQRVFSTGSQEETPLANNFFEVEQCSSHL